MIRTLAYLAAASLLSCESYGQDVFVNVMGGIAGNTGPQSKVIKSDGKGYATIAVDASVMGDAEYAQAGGGFSVFSIRNKAVFLFEQDILPDNTAKEYQVSMASPAVTIQGFVNGKLPVSKSGSYFFGGIRAGAITFGREEMADMPGERGRNTRGQVVMKGDGTIIYGLQLGFSTHNKNRVATGFNASWQRFSTKTNISYDALYYYDHYGIVQPATQNVQKEIPFSANLYTLQVFIRFCLVDDKVKIRGGGNTDCAK